MAPTIAVLAVQGAFIEHERRLQALGCEVFELRQAADLARPFDGLVLPGGESTVQAKLLRTVGLFDPLRERIAAGLPTLGTCAGLILLAERVEGAGDTRGLPADAAARRATVEGFRTLPATVSRNAYGRQLGSFRGEGLLASAAPEGPDETAARIPLTFIRAPRIEGLGTGTEPLVTLDGRPVAVRHGNQIGAAFHPELDADDTLYRLFLERA
ncbi:pyridoxal 5'-phosphate synthase glutaminase subunit PdxT [uncultured Adlercreutzia sp.]|uniref:pyridoxal 5'-phosphate synthase glutaminase subunit PdxT n=1 Tax=uncultured Adlercreutzia sp. TaxID=875803 RepID=UPI0026F39F14|nr:pyridoxal 5'-phosphate synthase glutaminase subunit PdxT [uncultured Adlercreutzia sp.]